MSVWLGSGCTTRECSFGRIEETPEACSLEEELDFVYDVLKDTYLFADQVPDLDLGQFSSSVELLSTITATVTPTDRYSFLLARQASDDRNDGFVPGDWGFRLGRYRLADDPDSTHIFLTRVFGTYELEPSTPASEAGLLRGDRVLSIDGEVLADMGNSELSAALAPAKAVFQMYRESTQKTFSVTLEKGAFARYTVPVVRVFDGQTGYIFFDSFLSRSIQELDVAFAALRQFDITKLILDLRWNGGGRSDASQHLLGLIAGEGADGQLAYTLAFNERHADCSSVYDVAFEKRTHSLPKLEEVVIITGPGTASASELVWNVLRAYVSVRVVGVESFGKPFGSFPYQFCDKVLSAINYRRTNAAGQSVPVEGIEPDCRLYDQLGGPLGSLSDNLLANALELTRSGQCLDTFSQLDVRLAPQSSTISSIQPPARKYLISGQDDPRTIY
ncbi:MAG: hypothetical protein KTR25_10440 [Myxococcales bacterium]|nr:hypothetical protein [Myxococcales bacterium]